MTETLTCQTCGTTWTREIAKGRKPRLCEACKESPTQVRKKQTLDEEEKRRVAAGRVFALEEALKARGTHIGQQDVISQLKEQVTKLEERVGALETRDDTSGKADRKRAAVHKKSRKAG